MIMTFQDWLTNGWLQKQPSSHQEIAGLLRKVDRDLTQCQSPDLSADWQLTIAYNAALGAATVALRASGFRVQKGAGHHLHTIQSLALTIQDNAIVSQFEKFAPKRHNAVYDVAGSVSDTEAEEMIELARRLRRDVVEWLRNNHPMLLRP
jgi:hypothetical protein